MAEKGKIMVQFSFHNPDIHCGNGILFASKSVLAVLTFCLNLLFAPSFLLGSQSNHSIRLGAFEYPPFYWEENGEVTGIGVDIIKELFGRLNIETRVTLYPLQRALEYAEQGRIDAIMILIKTRERSEYLIYTTPVMKVRGLVWSAVDRKGGAIHFSKPEDLRPYRIGATIGYSYGQELDNLLKTMDVVRVASDYQNFKKLMVRRIDIFLGNEIVAKGLFKKYPELKGKFHHSDKSFMEWILHMGISRKSSLRQMLPGINKAIIDLKQEGFIAETTKKHTE